MQDIFSKMKAANLQGWRRLSRSSGKDILGFIEPHEHYCVPMTSRIISGAGVSASGLKNSDFFMYYRDSRACAAVFAGNDSILVPVFPDNNIPEAGQLSGFLQTSRNIKKKYLTLMGETSSVRRFSELFTGRNSHSVDYRLLTASAAGIAALPPIQDRKIALEEIIIKVAVPADIDLLMPLRRAYEIEEVLLDPSTFNETACRIRFLETIRTKTVLYGVFKGRPVATCCVNASGLKWNQLGGVYTEPEFRSQGVSSAVLRKIAELSAWEGKNLTLFVKPANTPAVKLYENNGFIQKADYRISYLERR